MVASSAGSAQMVAPVSTVAHTLMMPFKVSGTTNFPEAPAFANSRVEFDEAFVAGKKSSIIEMTTRPAGMAVR